MINVRLLVRANGTGAAEFIDFDITTARMDVLKIALEKMINENEAAIQSVIDAANGEKTARVQRHSKIVRKIG